MGEVRNYLPPVHTSPETAYVIPDYPFGFRLRCKKRIWIESNKKGQRVVFQTTDPRRAVEYWNAPKASTYSEIKALYLDENGHVQIDVLTIYSEEKDIVAFEERAKAAIGEHERKSIDVMKKAANIIRSKVKATITPGPLQDIHNVGK